MPDRMDAHGIVWEGTALWNMIMFLPPCSACLFVVGVIVDDTQGESGTHTACSMEERFCSSSHQYAVCQRG